MLRVFLDFVRHPPATNHDWTTPLPQHQSGHHRAAAFNNSWKLRPSISDVLACVLQFLCWRSATAAPDISLPRRHIEPKLDAQLSIQTLERTGVYNPQCLQRCLPTGLFRDACSPARGGRQPSLQARCVCYLVFVPIPTRVVRSLSFVPCAMSEDHLPAKTLFYVSCRPSRLSSCLEC